MIIENGKKKKDAEIAEDTMELKEHESDDKKISIGVVASVCLFIVTLTVSIILITVTLRNSKPAAPTTQEPTQSAQTNDPPVEQQQHEQEFSASQEIRTVATSPDFPSGDLNANAFPAFSYTPDGYATYYATIDHVMLAADVPDEAAQQVAEAFACNMYALNWNNPEHVLYVEGKAGDWWSVEDLSYGFEMYINREKNVVMYKDEGISPEEQYNILSVIYNHYNSISHTVYCLGTAEGIASAYVEDTKEYFAIDADTYEILNVMSEEEVISGAGGE